MRVITGAKRGMKLLSPAQDSPIRPTADRTKESVFNLIHDGIDGVFLDLFAGSGQMGIEALSRGAKKAVFCDNEKPRQTLSGQTSKKLDLQTSRFFTAITENILRQHRKNSTLSLLIRHTTEV